MILNKNIRIVSFEQVYNFRDMGGYQTVMTKKANEA